MIAHIAQQRPVARYDWFHISAGSNSILRWTERDFAQSDHVHLTLRGYHRKGWLLAQALLRAVGWSDPNAPKARPRSPLINQYPRKRTVATPSHRLRSRHKRGRQFIDKIKKGDSLKYHLSLSGQCCGNKRLESTVILPNPSATKIDHLSPSRENQMHKTMNSKQSQLKRREKLKPMIRCDNVLPILFVVMGMASVAMADTPKEEPAKVVSYVSKGGCKKQPLPARVIAIGSSTMRGALGPRLSRVFKKDPHISFHLWGKSASGLARPDYFDWPKKVLQLIDKKKPDAWIVSLGTNDFQGLRMPDKSWIRFGSEKWIKEYTVRVHKLLEQMAGTDRNRTIIYIGPTAYSQKKFVGKMGVVISQIIREQIQAFTGPAIFYDAFSITSTAKNKAKKSFKHPESKRRYHIHGSDNIHLSRKALEFLLQKPVVKLLRDCLAGINPS